MDAGGETLDHFDCPRCATAVTERFWGPCGACRDALRAAYVASGDGATATKERFEPAMNVTPNFVATKD
jgi:hypothetical protein